MYKCTLSIVLIITVISFFGCLNYQSTASQNKTTVDVFSEEYYNSAANNSERLQRLISGLFVFYHDDPNSTDIVKWDVNEKNDSIMGYALPVGEVNKVGYWVYNVQFMTSVPNNPIHTSFVNLVQKSRDSIIAVFYVPQNEVSPAEAFQKGKEAFRDVKFSELEKSIEITYVKENNTLFKGQSALHLNPRQNNPNAKFKLDHFNASIKQTSFFSVFYPKNEIVDSLKRVGVNQYMYKIDPQKSPIVKVLKEMEIE